MTAQTITTNYTTIETDVSLPDDLFVFQPPPGSKLGEPVLVEGVVRGVAGGLAPGAFSPPPPPPPPKKVEGQADASGRVSATDAVQQAKLIRRVPPVYPALAKQGRIQGVVGSTPLSPRMAPFRNLL